MGVLDFLSKEAGQARRRALDERIAGVLDRVGYYAGPEMSEFGRGLLQVGGMLNPVQDVGNAMAAGRDGRWGDMAVDVATVVAPVAAGKAAKAINPRLADDAAQWLEDALTGLSVNPTRAGLGDAAQRFAADESGVFAGVNALTADKSALNKAIDMTKAGASRDDIWRETGWFKGVDGKWRFEIDDSGAYSAIKDTADEIAEGIISQDAPLTLGEVFGHDVLFEAYPSIGDVDTRLVPRGDLDAIVPGSYGGVTKGGNLVLRNDIIETGRPLHEIQHLIQRAESFAPGGDPRVWGHEDYMRLSGEVEARNAANRGLFDPELRRSVPPWETEDVPEVEQIIPYRASPLPTPTTPAEQKAQGVLDLLASGRADEVTDDMLAAADDRYLFQNYDLPMDEASRMARAREMGFDTDTPLYHGTGADFQAFDLSNFGQTDEGWFGRGVYSSGQVSGDFDANLYAPRDGGSVMPVIYADQSPIEFSAYPPRWLNGDAANATAEAQSRGFDGVRFFSEGYEEPVSEAVTFDPRNIRSRFARFDPRLSHLRNLSAGVGGLGLLSQYDQQQDDLEQQTRQYLGGLL